MTPPPARPPNTYRALLRLYPYVKPAMGRIYWGMAAALIAGIVALLIPQVLRALVDGPLQNGNRSELITPVILVVGLGILEAAMIWLRRWLVLQPGTHVEAAMRNGLYRKLQDLPVSFHDRWPSGQLLSRAVSDLNQIRRWLSFGIVLLVVNALTIAIGLIFLISINWILGGLFLLCSIPLWIYGYLFENKYSSVARLSQDQTGDLATSVEESVHGIRVLKAFGRGRDALATFGTQAEGLRATEIEKAKAVAGIWLWLLLIPDVTFALGLLGGVWLAANGELTVGELAAFFATASVLRFPVESIGFLLSMTLDTKNAVDRFFEVMDTENTITDPAHPLSHPTSAGELTFDSVHYRYPDAPPTDPDLLNGVTLTVHSGETLALVGITGSGKSTLTALTTRLYDVTGGSIRLDGHDIRDLTRTELRTHIAMAFEDAILFSASVRDNIAMGRPDATDADIDEAIQIAQAAFVYDLPAGLDTLIGEEGMSLSGGQRQRLALARAVAARPAILMLDDPLSALDVDTEALVEAALRSVLTTTTAVIVAHRPSTVMLADRVALLDGGTIAAIGTHTHLLATNERYRHVISSLEDELTREQAARA